MLRKSHGHFFDVILLCKLLFYHNLLDKRAEKICVNLASRRIG